MKDEDLIREEVCRGIAERFAHWLLSEQLDSWKPKIVSEPKVKDLLRGHRHTHTQVVAPT